MKRYILLPLLAFAVSCGSPKNATESDSLPPIWPDYSEVTVPYNIAPLDFGVKDACRGIAVTVTDKDGRTVLSDRGRKCVRFNLKRWHGVLADNSGEALTFNVFVRHEDGWHAYRPFNVHVSPDSIDYGLTYRLIMAGYQSFGHMGIYERRLSDFHQRTLIDNRMADDGCLNCHTPDRTDPSSFSLHVRGAHSATLLYHDGEMECLNTITDTTGGFFVYPYWHPSGDYISYSVNKTKLSFYTSTDRRVEVYDQASDVIVYHPSTHEVLLSPLIRRKDKFETYPAFSRDGGTLYFCSSDAADLPSEMKKNVYSLCSIGFNASDGTFADKIDTLLCGPELNMSFCTPRPSFDGKYIMLAGMDYGTFPLWHKEADLYLYDIGKAELRSIDELNSGDSESFHNWSGNSRWVVFSSRRDDGLYTRLYIAHVEDDGTFGKPFILPQRDPVRYYGNLEYSYNIPDFTSSPVPLDVREVRTTILSKDRTGVHIRK